MEKNQNNQNNVAVSGQAYVAPNIEIINIQTEQNILGGSGGASDDLPGDGIW